MFDYDRLLSLFTLSHIGSFASLISLIVSVYVAFNLRAIKKDYIFRLRAPEFMKALKKCASVLNEYGNDFENSIEEISDELTRVDVKLGSMRRRMRRTSKKSVKQLRSHIKAYEKDASNKEKFRQIYRGIQRVLEEVKASSDELKLE